MDHLSNTCMWVYMKSVKGQLSARLLWLRGVFYFTLDFSGTAGERLGLPSLSLTQTPLHTHTQPYLEGMC